MRRKAKLEVDEFMRDAERGGGTIRFGVNMGAFREAATKAAEGAPFDYQGWVVREEKVKARRVLTIAVDDAKVWHREGEQIVPMLPGGVDFTDALVRVFPPHDASPAVIGSLRSMLDVAGARRVVVRPRAPSPAVVLTDKRKAAPRLAGRASMRVTVLQMAAEANAPNTELLCDFVESCLSKAGL